MVTKITLKAELFHPMENLQMSGKWVNATTWQKWLRDVHVNHPRSRRGGAFFYSNSQVVRGADKKASVLLGKRG